MKELPGIEKIKLEKIKEEIIGWALRLYEKDFLASADGNLSVRVDGNYILITASGVHKGFLSYNDFALMDISGEVINGNPSGEREMHLAIYRQVPEAQAVIHAHPPHAIAWSIAAPELSELPKECLSELILACGSVPVVPYARPGTSQMGQNVCRYVPDHKAMILSRHGALTWGETLFEAFCAMERLEHSAKILLLAKTIGPLSPLPKEEVLELQQMRHRIGNRIL
ncbi:MAG: class II aldolase/adducin family protein [Pseudobdellovibrionaceae bacterium]|nr:class II aldolase/adducin family protein [Pseudobdellovibrionaceae bacterium]